VTYSTVRLCSGGGAYEAIPEPKLKLDLGAVRARLEAEKVPVVDARVMLIVALEREVTISRDGRILIKSRDPEQARRLFEEVRARIEPAAAPEKPST
jgi:hypothetical protein